MATVQITKIATRVGIVSFKSINNGARYVARVNRSELPKIRIKTNADGVWEATSPTVEGSATGKTAELAFKRSVAVFWN